MQNTQIIVIDKIKHIKGYKGSIKTSSLYICLRLNRFLGYERNLSNFDKLIHTYMKNTQLQFLTNSEEDILKRFLFIYEEIRKHNDILLEYKPIINRNNTIELYIPIFGNDFPLQKNIFLLTADLMNGNFNNNFHTTINNITQQIVMFNSVDNNQKQLLRIAKNKNVIYKHLYKKLYQYGYGKNLRRLKGTISDKTSSTSINLVRNKMMVKKILKDNGLPINESYFIYSIKDAINIAQKLTYPVVIKPADSDAGNGVTAFILNEIELKKAFDKAIKFSKNIIIEKHFQGKEYRFNLYNKEIFEAFEKTPACIIGNGKNSIKQLIDKYNNKDNLLENEIREYIDINDDLKRLLELQSVTLNFIPKKNQYVRLSNTANLNTGRSVKNLSLNSDVHKENILLLKRLVEIVGLDIAGIDFFCEDITKPWYLTNTAISEINSEPMLFNKSSFDYLFDRLIVNNGEIPSIICVGKYNEKLIQDIQKELTNKNINLGIANSKKVLNNEEVLSYIPLDNLYDRANILMNNSTIDAMVLFVEDIKDLDNGIPLINTNLFVVLKECEEELFPLIRELIEYFDTQIYIEEQSIFNKENKQVPLEVIKGSILEIIIQNYC